MSKTDEAPVVRTAHEPGRLRVSVAFSPAAHRDLCHAQSLIHDMVGVVFSKSVIARVGVELLRQELEKAHRVGAVDSQRELVRMAIAQSSGRRIPSDHR